MNKKEKEKNNGWEIDQLFELIDEYIQEVLEERKINDAEYIKLYSTKENKCNGIAIHLKSEKEFKNSIIVHPNGFGEPFKYFRDYIEGEFNVEPDEDEKEILKELGYTVY